MVCKGQLLCMFWRSQLSVLQRHNLIWHVDRRMNRQTNWRMVWKLERLWDPPRGITDPLFPWNKQACFTVPKESKIVFLCSMFPNFAFVPCSTQNVTFVPCSPGINAISPVSQNPWEGLHYVDVIFSHIEQKEANRWPICEKTDGRTKAWNVNPIWIKSSKYLTLAGKSRFWYQIAPGALGPCFMSILVLQPSSLSFWCIVVWLFLGFVFGLWLWYFLIILTYYFLQNFEPDLDPNCSSLYPVSTYYIRNQATGVSLAGRYWAVMGCWLDIAVIWLVCGKKNQHTKRL